MSIKRTIAHSAAD